MISLSDMAVACKVLATAVAKAGIRTRIAAASFFSDMLRLLDLRLAQDLRGLVDSDLQRLKDGNRADGIMRLARAIEAHNKAQQEALDSPVVVARVSREEAEADAKSAEADKLRAEAEAIRAATDERRRRLEAHDEVEAALRKLGLEGGSVMLDPDELRGLLQGAPPDHLPPAEP